MRVKYFIIIIIAFAVIPISSEAKLAVHPEKISLNLHGGEHVTKYLVVAHTESVPLAVIIKTKIYPDREGINITYSKQNFVLFPDQPEIIQMDIDVAKNIKPGKYVIKTQFNTSVLQKIVVNQTNATYAGIKNITAAIEQIIKELENCTTANASHNMTQIIQQLEQLKEQLKTISNTSIREQNTVNALVQQLNESQKEIERLRNTFEMVLIATVLYAVVITLLALLRNKPGGGDKK
ncbi:MAG: hypothetical protein DRH06_00380 [Deltaproteobacteria bacterium]|nr:MAG: hypothetical protein DRH06_00380 [Deltaproteobacteria bacterium]